MAINCLTSVPIVKTFVSFANKSVKSSCDTLDMSMYGSEVLFIGKEILVFETVHLSFLKNMLGVKQATTSVTIYGDTGKYPLFLKQLIVALKYWIRLISLPESCYLRIVYNSLASLDFIGETNWCSHIRSLLFRTNHRDVWENHRVSSNKVNYLFD